VIDCLKRVKDPQKEPVLFFYFDYTDQANQTLEKVVASFLKQLLCASGYVPKEVEAVYDDYSKRGVKPDFASLSSLLDTCSVGFSTVYLILDALDEYQETRHKNLVSFLTHLKDSTEAKFKVLCTTRPHLQDLADDLKAGTTFEIEPHNPDIEIYVKHRLNVDWQYDTDLQSEVIEAIMGQKDIKYIYVFISQG
jgi:hypothetical protein